jgi:hypothetical protein
MDGALKVGEFLRKHRSTDPRYIYAVDTRRSNEEILVLEHWRAGIARSINSKFVNTITPLGVFLDNNPHKPLVSIDFNQVDSPEVQRISSFGGPIPLNVTLIPYPSPPGGDVDVQCVQFFSTEKSRINCLFSNAQPEPPRRPIERMAGLYKNDYFIYYDLLTFFTESSPSATVDLDYYDYYYAMAAFTRPRGSTANWQPSPVQNIAVKDDRFVFTYIDCVFDGGITGGPITITSSIEVIFGD